MTTNQLALAMCAAYTAYKTTRDTEGFKTAGRLARKNYRTWDLCSRDTELWDPLMTMWINWKRARRVQMKRWILSECIFPGRYPDSSSFKARQEFDLAEARREGVSAMRMVLTPRSDRLEAELAQERERMADLVAQNAELKARSLAQEAAAAASKSAMQAAMQAMQATFQ